MKKIEQQIWVTRALALAIVVMAILWGLSAEMWKKSLQTCLVGLKNLEKQITMQGTP